MVNKPSIAQYIDQTILKQTTTLDDVEYLCRKSIEFGFAGVCIPPYYTAAAHKILAESNTKLVTVVGYPMGYSDINAKAYETKRALSEGADEIDMVMNIAALKTGMLNHVADGIESIKTLCGMSDKLIKVIIETAVLNKEEIEVACGICADKQVDFVKTSTGIVAGGATIEAVTLLRKLLPDTIKIKASGGIKTYDQAMVFINAGADRIGTSSGFTIIENT